MLIGALKKITLRELTNVFVITGPGNKKNNSSSLSGICLFNLSLYVIARKGL